MSDTQRRQLCRLSFLLFAVLPTITVAAWLIWPRGGAIDPATIGYVLGWQLDVEDARTLSESETLWRQVSLSDRTLGDVGKIGQVEIEHSERRLSLLADHFLLHEAASDTFFRDLIDRFLLRPTTPLESVHIRINRFTLEQRSIADDGSIETHPIQTFEDVAFDLESAHGLTELTLRLRPAGSEVNAFVELTVRRHASLQDSPDSLQWSFSTGSHSIACQLGRSWLPFLDALGETATFRGKVHGTRDAQRWSAELHGEFNQVDLYRLVSVPLHHTLQGDQAIARFETLKIEAGRIVDVNGLLYCPEGQVSRTLVDAAMLHFGWKQYAPPSSWPTRFRELFVAFATSESADQLEVRGGHANGVLAFTSAGDPWLVESTAPIVPTTALVALLVPPSSAEVPLSRETATLANLLPLPSQRTLVPTESGAQRLRLDDE